MSLARLPVGVRAALLLVLVLVIAGSVYLTSGRESEGVWLEKVLMDALSPIQSVLTAVSTGVASVEQQIVEIRNLKRENQRLKETVEILKAENMRLREYERENAWLRDALEFQKTSEYSLIASEVVARDPGNWFNTLTIDKGSAHGIGPGMPVVSPEGVVGRTQSVASHSAKVMLLTDSRSAIGGLVQRTGDLVLVEGSMDKQGRLRTKPLSRSPDLVIGDLIVTSGLSQIFPKGLGVGEIVGVEKNRYGEIEFAWVMPFADLSHLEHVLVITGKTPEAVK